MNWDMSEEDRAICLKIAKRCVKGDSNIMVMMDLSAVHCNGNPIRLQDLLDANDFDFFHDMVGINENVCHDTGKLKNHFLPRFSVRQ